MSTPTFKWVHAESSSELFEWFSLHGSRRIDSVHLHHTHMPNIALFDSLADSLGSDEAAGQELCRRMWRYHTAVKGWSAMAQHVTVDPVGRIWLGRPFDRPPASARGHNGSYASGPLMIEMIGQFDVVAEVLSDKQRNATLDVVEAVMRTFELLPSTSLRFHSDMSAKSCPGTALDKRAWVEELGKRLNGKDAPKRRKAGGASSIGADLALLHSLLDPAEDTRTRSLSDSELLAELPESDMSIDDIARMSRGTGVSMRDIGAGSERGGKSASLNQAMIRQLKPYVVNLEQGQLSDDGKMITLPEDLDALIDSLEAWVRKQLSDGDESTVPRVMLYAHGGINSEEDSLLFAYEYHQWWLQQGVYPIFFVWETGVLETVMQLLEEYAGRGGAERGFVEDLQSGLSRVRDAAVEKFVNTVGRDFWTIMKLSAQRASSLEEGGGAAQLAGKLMSLQERLTADFPKPDDQSEGPILFSAVGHSAGAIFHSCFVNACTQGSDKSLWFDDVTFMAPACTIDLFLSKIKKPLTEGRIGRINLMCLDRETEAADPTVPFYGKSLLHLVSNGFEKDAGTPILGMEKYILADEYLRQLLGLSGERNVDTRLIVAPSGAEEEQLRSNARTHGGFARDYDTMRTVAMSLRRITDASSVPPFPSRSAATRGDGRLFRKLDNRLDHEVVNLVRGGQVGYGVAAAPETHKPLDPNPMPHQVPMGKRKAICIGIDGYQGNITPLKGCVNDARNWGELLEEYDFEVEYLLEKDASLSGMKQAIGQLVRDAKSEDIVVIQYAGHGVQFEDLNSDEEDFMDEALVPFDCRDKYFLSDDELWELLQGGRSAIHVFMDCCHSKSNTRAPHPPGAVPRIVIPSADMMRMHRERMHTDGVKSANKSIESMRHVKFAAAGDAEYAYEHGGNGKFTTAALAAIRSIRTPISNHDFLLEVEKHFEGDSRQHPGLECPTRMKFTPFLSGVSIAPP
ncbi:caspase family protein [Granulosicoccus sp. 3-233]|uniref:caspase family protein n=1 Tax=Granulosicoccus sp. 3-233 TaxID=3417969 RepID=UPI003D3420C4